MTNPFDEVQTALWAAVLDYPPFVTQGNAAYIRPLNRLAVVKGVDGTLPADKMVNRGPGGDVPELLITQGGFALTPQGPNSKTASGQQTYIVQMLDKRATTERINAIKWAFYLAMIRATVGHRTPFDLPYVSDWNIVNTSELRQLNEENQQQGEWVAVLSVQVDLYWPKTELIGLPT